MHIYVQHLALQRPLERRFFFLPRNEAMWSVIEMFQGPNIKIKKWSQYFLHASQNYLLRVQELRIYVLLD